MRFVFIFLVLSLVSSDVLAAKKPKTSKRLDAACKWMFRKKAESVPVPEVKEEAVREPIPAAPAPRFSLTRSEVKEFKFDMPGMKVASLSDATLATGATLFLFEKGATANFDARGGSVATVETSLLKEGSYENTIDGIVFAGGSTMGIEATQGVRRRIYRERAQNASDFDFVPAVPGAVVYDFGGRVEPGQRDLVFPDLIMGAALYDQAKENTMLIGRAGAGTTTTANKISQPIWGGQGAAFAKVQLGGTEARIFTAVVLNPTGNILVPSAGKLNPQDLQNVQIPRGVRQNTTLSIVVTDVALDRSQLKRLAVMVHTSMAGSISPFHGYTDGDVLFVVSLNKKNVGPLSEDQLQMTASELMKQAILRSVQVANRDE